MPRLELSKLRPGFIVAKDVYIEDGRVLLARGVTLTPMFIERLKQFGIDSVFVMDQYSRVDVYETIIDSTMLLVNRTLRKYVRPNGLNKGFEDAMFTVESIFTEILQNRTVLNLLTDLRSIEDHTYTHCVHVSVLSLIVGISMSLSKTQLLVLGTGGLLHDIGKTSIPPEVLLKKDPLTPEEFKLIRNHVNFGANILRSIPNIHPDVIEIAYQHHERYNGSGYPQGLTFHNVNESAKIVAVADVFDALTENRAYRKQHSPHEALEFLLGSGNYFFDAKTVRHFVENISIYRLGSLVKLSDGQIGMVTNISKYISARPIILILYDKNRNRVTQELEIDLGDPVNATVHIIKVLD
ncbi:HD-GYP domain-containing protein [Heliobacterium chlorum]|uniref:HD-GYP domain-containing protein n=1 Tax=Heliobacterium chlorum TaxID=2698 RepID=A0ABR7T2Q8_HELCL|nr:HD-GYP domain-containing protein [Heliobacterium chlorum]MBC9783941.1 HD-GYP domain-containing protein [Heliobacterium chlorum]